MPTSQADGLVRRNLVLRAFAVRSGASYTAMLGGLARVTDDQSGRRAPLVTDPDGGLSKDVWVVSREPVAATRVVALRGRVEDEAGLVAAGPPSVAMVPRVLSDLFWFGRYAERAEDLLRLILATRTVAIETDSDSRPAGRYRRCWRRSPTSARRTPGSCGPAWPPCPSSGPCCWTGSGRERSPSRSTPCRLAAAGVRDQLSDDVWMVLAEIERALAALAADPNDQGLQLADAGERVLSGLLALAGIATENMVRDPGWYMLDSGRGLERALQVVALLRVTLTRARPVEVERLVFDAVLTASESILTFRRRYRGRTGVEAVVELLVTDGYNPRSVAYQLRRMLHDLRAIPNTSPTARPVRLLDSLTEKVRVADLRGARRDRGRPAARRWTASSPVCRSSCGRCPRRSATSTSRCRRAHGRCSRWRELMTEYRIEHTTTYTYDAEVTGSYGQFHLRPRDLPWQTCLAHEILVDPEPSDLFRHTDLYGNTQSYFHVTRPHTTLRVTGVSMVRVEKAELDPDALAQPWEQARPRLRPDEPDAWEATDFTFPSPYVEIPDGMVDYARVVVPRRAAHRRGGDRADAAGQLRLHLQVRLDHDEHQGGHPAAEPHRRVSGLLPLHGLRAALARAGRAATSAATWPPGRRSAGRGWSAPTPATPGWAAGFPGPAGSTSTPPTVG